MSRLPTHFKAESIETALERWLLPEVGSSHTVALAEKPIQNNAEVDVVEEEIVAEKVTLAELESIREGAYEEGFNQGKQDGYQFGLQDGQQKGLTQGLSQGEAAIQAKTERLSSLIDDLVAPINHKHDVLAQWVANLSLNVAKTVLSHEAAIEKDIVRQSVAQALAELPDSSNSVTVRLNPLEADLLKDQLQSQLTSQRKDCMVIPDASVAEGGCLIESENTLVDHSLDFRLEQVSAVFIEHLRTALSDSQSENNDTSHESV